MKSYFFFFLVLLFRTSLAQNHSPEQVVALSKTYQEKGLYFREMPHFDRDSTVYYFDKAAALLQNSEPLQYKILAELYRDITDRANRSHNFIIVDSLAPIGWSYYEKIPDDQKDKVLGYDLLINWALIKIIRGEPKPGLELFEKAMNLLKDDPRPEIQLKVLNNKGRFYYQYGLPEEEEIGIQYLKESINGYQNSDYPEKREALVVGYKLLTYHFGNSNPDSTDFYMDRFQELLPELTNPFHHAWYYYSIGNNLIDRGKFVEAKPYLIENIKLLEDYNLTTIDIYQFSHSLLGDIAKEEGRFDDAIANYQKAKNSSIAIDTKSNTAYFIWKLYGVYEQMGDYKKALEHYIEYSEANNIIEVERNERSLRESELQVNLLQQDKKLIAKQQEQTIYIVALFIGTLLLGLLFRNYRLKQRSNQKLEVLNGELAQKNTLLDKRNAENELLLREIHHRVKNNMEVVSSLLQLQSSQINDPSVQEAMISSQNRVHSMGIIHQKLYQGDHLSSIEMRDYFINLSENILDSFNASGKIKVECNMAKLILDVDTAISIGLITNELLTNSLKYAFEGKDSGTIKISLSPISNEEEGEVDLQLIIRDDGIGKADNQPSKGTGFGTQLVDLLTRQLGGKLTYENNNGTVVSLLFKKTNIA
ncbi:tetratricopeptide repeat-containing sensor histidine kinase [Mongoliibacter ruber]|uniref:histidine kinase n=1 Tax=Mongoliibacter ruber TaxID=1750599 RepID=A0A2T0WDH8_9BACT|nr:histidine kinase dimerization/phosphoacceptor domain -containing protein [Mongoliibacter ruber]PRY84751.1 two-component sensor histidine kinase [Mongoliibacter ruber]